MSRVYVETDKSKTIEYRLLNPHYTDDRFRQGQTVFLAPGYKADVQFGTEMVEGVSYDYSDRLDGWHSHEVREAAWKVAESKDFAKNSAAVIEAFLRELFKDPDLTSFTLLQVSTSAMAIRTASMGTSSVQKAIKYKKRPRHRDD